MTPNEEGVMMNIHNRPGFWSFTKNFAADVGFFLNDDLDVKTLQLLGPVLTGSASQYDWLKTHFPKVLDERKAQATGDDIERLAFAWFDAGKRSRDIKPPVKKNLTENEMHGSSLAYFKSAKRRVIKIQSFTFDDVEYETLDKSYFALVNPPEHSFTSTTQADDKRGLLVSSIWEAELLTGPMRGQTVKFKGPTIYSDGSIEHHSIALTGNDLVNCLFEGISSDELKELVIADYEDYCSGSFYVNSVFAHNKRTSVSKEIKMSPPALVWMRDVDLEVFKAGLVVNAEDTELVVDAFYKVHSDDDRLSKFSDLEVSSISYYSNGDIEQFDLDRDLTRSHRREAVDINAMRPGM